jgi:NADPH:quinone reductase-like Zn-dependent oxidoreductase
VGDKTNRAAIGGSGIYLFNPQMVLRSLRGLVGLGESYVCIDFAYERKWLEELPNLPQEKIVIDSTFSFSEVEQAFTRLNTGRTKGKVVVTI